MTSLPSICLEKFGISDMFTLNSKKMLFEALPEINNSGFSRHLYGEVYHDELDEYTSNNRTTFTSSPFINQAT